MQRVAIWLFAIKSFGLFCVYYVNKCIFNVFLNVYNVANIK